MKTTIQKALFTVALCATTLLSQADTITLGGTNGAPYERQATLGANATAGGIGDGNASSAKLNALFSGTDWTIAGDVNQDSSLTNGFLTVTVDAGGWGQAPANGTWSIASGFYALYGAALISMHVGNGTGEDNPDFFAWTIETGGTSGTWSYDGNTGGGGGLSNLQLWGNGTGRQVPDGGTTAVLLGLALVGMGLIAHRRKTA